MKQFLIYCCSLILISCLSKREKRETEKREYILGEMDLIPEGLAFDARTQTIFVSSTYKRKIVTIDGEGKIADFITEGQDDIKSVIGMEVDGKRNCIWVISSEALDVLPLKNPGIAQWRSSVFQFSLGDGKLMRKYELDKDSVFLNDLTVADDGSVYVTESIQKTIYVLRPGSGSLETFVELKPYQFINGISFSDKPGYLFVASTEGIVRIDLATKSFALLPQEGSPKSFDIDGLSFWKDHFIGHQSAAVTRFYLSSTRDRIVKADTLDSGKEFDSSTTGEVSVGNYYFIVNSQIQSGIDYKNRKIKPLDSLSSIIIRKIKL